MTDTQKEETTDPRGGVKFGISMANDDDDGEYVTELPTLDEERRMMHGNGEDAVRAREMAEMDDAGRARGSRGGVHPSTMANRNQVRTLCVMSCIVWNE